MHARPELQSTGTAQGQVQAPVGWLDNPAALGLSGDPVHEPVHARALRPGILLLYVNIADDVDPRRKRTRRWAGS